MELTRSTSHNARRDWMICLALIGGYLALRLPHLREMPMFTDETTYARWAQLILQDPRHNLFVSLTDAKPPLHYWLLAATRWLAVDPILAGRLLSVFVGILIFPALVALCGEIARLGRGVNRSLLILFGGTLLIVSPLIAQQQRMIMAEALLLPLMVTMAWLSLRLGRLIAEDAPRRRVLTGALWLGITWATALLTKQVFSYFFWGFVPLALLANCRWDSWKRTLQKSVLPVTMFTFLGAACFVPLLFIKSGQPLKSLLLYKPVFLPPAEVSRFEIAWSHLLQLFWPQAQGALKLWPHDPAAPLQNGILYLYLTPPILVIVLIAFGWMIWRGAGRLALFLGGWFAAFVSVFLFGSNSGVFMPRYMTLPVVLLLLACAWFLSDAAGKLRLRFNQMPATGLTAALCALLLAWPASVTVASVGSWRAPVYTAIDAGQYVTEFGGGQVSEQTLLWLAEQANDHPITIVTGSWIGSPNDAIWLYLSGNPNIQLYWDGNRETPLHPVRSSTYLLGMNRWVDRADKPVTLDLSRPTYFVVSVIHFQASPLMYSFVQLQNLPPTQTAQNYFNPRGSFPSLDYQEMVILRLDPVFTPADPMGPPAPMATAEEPSQP